MLGTRIRQKDGTFYFVSYKAQDLLEKAQFISRYYFEGEQIQAETHVEDDITRFIAKIEKNEKAFQRILSRRKVGDIVNFYETSVAQPLIPGTVLLFTEEELSFEPLGEYETMGNLKEPNGKYLIIDGQHRLAALHFYKERHPDEIDQINVPCVIFDGKAADFAAEMFVIINSTHTKINKSHLIDLMERVSWESRDKKFAAGIVHYLYEDGASPLQYKINKLGGRSRQEKWILQSELFNEIHKLVQNNMAFFEKNFDLKPSNAYPLFRDYLKSVKITMESVWGRQNYMFTKAVTIKAIIRILGELIKNKAIMNEWASTQGHEAFKPLLSPWTEMANRFRADGFYERFPAKGQLERTTRIYRELLNTMGIEKAETSE